MGDALVADDDINLSLFWEKWLEKANYTVTRVTTRDAALAAFKQGTSNGIVYALAVLDMQMPNSHEAQSINAKAGLEAALQMRQLDPGAPVLFLTASLDEDIEADALQLPGHGAKAFSRKPCGMRAFQLRAQQMGRNSVFRFGPRAVINKNTRAVTITGEKNPRPISGQVFDLAQVFNQNKGKTLTYATLVAQWGWDEISLADSVSRLRKAAGDDTHAIIKTVQGAGYIYDPPAA